MHCGDNSITGNEPGCDQNFTQKGKSHKRVQRKNQHKVKSKVMLLDEEMLDSEVGVGSKRVLATPEVNLVKVEFTERGEGGTGEGEKGPLNLCSIALLPCIGF